MLDLKRQNGINLKKEENGIKNNMKLVWEIEKKKNLFVNIVEKNMKHIRMGRIDFVLTNVRVLGGEKLESMILKENVLNVEKVLKSTSIEKLKNVEIAQVSKVRKIGKDNVYNMEVEDLHNYIANGIVVHNCRYLIMEYSLTGRAPIV